MDRWDIRAYKNQIRIEIGILFRFGVEKSFSITSTKCPFMKNLILILLIATLTDVETMLSQCVPAALDDCYGVESPILCTLNELNGYSCTTPTIQNPTACLPCNGSGTPNNSQWWAFIAQGGSVTITINYSDCYIPEEELPVA